MFISVKQGIYGGTVDHTKRRAWNVEEYRKKAEARERGEDVDSDPKRRSSAIPGKQVLAINYFE
jgi:hypothetical protein